MFDLRNKDKDNEDEGSDKSQSFEESEVSHRPIHPKYWINWKDDVESSVKRKKLLLKILHF